MIWVVANSGVWSLILLHVYYSSLQVFESNHESSVMACSIEGPCDVLPPAKYKEETERRSHRGSEANVTLRPLFLCKYVYIHLIVFLFAH